LLEDKWREGIKHLERRMPSKGEEEVIVLHNLLSELSPEQLHNEYRWLTSQKGTVTPYQYDLVEYYYEQFRKESDTRRIVGMLSKRCVRQMGPTPLEMCLALDFGNPVPILEAIYKATACKNIRELVLDAMRTAFTELPYLPDKRIFAEASRWYEVNKDHIEVNWDYRDYFDIKFYAGPRVGMFKERNGTKVTR
jgi:hypothetical protein